MSYTKKTWVNGETIYAADLNHMEDGIESANAAAAFTPAEGAGADLSEIFDDADALYDAYHAEDYSKIHIGDFYPVTLTGEYYDYGFLTLQVGQKYYSDTACTTEVGEAEAIAQATPILNNNLPGSHEAYCEVTVGGTKRYCVYDSCLPYFVRSLNNAVMKFEIAGINTYWRYGDSGTLSGAVPHLVMCPRDCLPTSLKWRKTNETWEGAHLDTFTGDGTTAEFTLSGTVGTIGYVWVAGSKKTYNTDYTYASNKVTFKAGKIPTNGQEIKIEWMDGVTPWTGSALYKTFNDPDHGIIKLIQTADAKLYSHILNSMRYLGETRMKTGTQGSAWTNRGALFLPTEDEIWGKPCYAANASYASCYMLQWPLFAAGRRHVSKGVGDGASRTHWWAGSSTNTTIAAYVRYSGYPHTNSASYAYGAAPCFILS